MSWQLGATLLHKDPEFWGIADLDQEWLGYPWAWVESCCQACRGVQSASKYRLPSARLMEGRLAARRVN